MISYFANINITIAFTKLLYTSNIATTKIDILETMNTLTTLLALKLYS